MRLGKSSFLVFFCAFFLATALMNIRSVSSTTTVLSLSPAIVYESLGDRFLVNVTVSGVELLYDWQANVTFSSSVLRVISVTEGDFLKRQPEGTYGPAPVIKASSAFFAWTTVGGYVGESGSGTLATIEFEVLASGESLIEFAQIGDLTYLEAQTSPNPPPNFDMLEFTVQNAIFVNTVVPPFAAFTYSPIVPAIDEMITFNATASNATEPAQIMEYFWDFGDETNATVNTPVIEHSYSQGGDYIVSLTIIDNATAPALVQTTFGTTGMPRLWYELFSTETQDVAVAIPHDIAVTSVSLSKTEVVAGETVSITAIVLNKGTETNSFSVKAYYDVNEVDTKQVSDLESAEQETLVFEWNTAGVPEGNYRITVEVPAVEGETVVANNRFIDGTVKVTPGGGLFPIELMIGGAIVAIVLVIGLGVFLRRRGRSA